MILFLRMVGHFLLFLFIAVVMIDPTNTLFHAKELTFALLMLFSVVRYQPDLTYIPHILIIVSALFLGYLSAEMQGNPRYSRPLCCSSCSALRCKVPSMNVLSSIL